MPAGEVPDDELARPRKFTTASLHNVATPWFQQADPLDTFHVSSVMLELSAGRWWTGLDWVRDVIMVNDFHVRARAGLVVTVRLAAEYPGFIQLIRIGPFSPSTPPSPPPA